MNPENPKNIIDDQTQQKLNGILEFIAANEDIEYLLRNSASWADSRKEQLEKSEAKAWRVSAISLGIVLIALIVSVSVIMKSYQPAPPPEILVLDKSSGHVEPLISLKEVQENVEDSVIRHYISEFIRCRENYTFDTAEEGYYCAAAFMSPQLQAQWGEYWDTTSPKSPMNYYKKDATIRAEINSMTVNPSSDAAPTVIVRFTRNIKHNNQNEITHWVATIAYKFVNLPTSEKDRRENPLGLQVTVYQIDQDIGTGAPVSTSTNERIPSNTSPNSIGVSK